MTPSSVSMPMTRSIGFALVAALLFGASTPLAKSLLGELSPWLLAGLLYLGSGVGLAVVRLVRDRGWTPSGLAPGEWRWLLGATVFGGLLGPLALLQGLQHTVASTASLLLNLEAVLTTLLAWLVFREHVAPRIVLGMASIVGGGLLLAWTPDGAHLGGWSGPLGVVAACLCWAIDNNLTRRVSASDAVFLAMVKGLTAGSVNTVLGLAMGATLPLFPLLAQAMLLGFFGYGVSLVLFVLALRGLGSARTGAYFSTAPFIGAAIAIGLLGEQPTALFWAAAAAMGLGVWLHLTERHDHEHTHEALAHSHWHVHDIHHQHDHDPAWSGEQPHLHWHVHEALTHSHPHFPDIHHRHDHPGPQGRPQDEGR